MEGFRPLAFTLEPESVFEDSPDFVEPSFPFAHLVECLGDVGGLGEVDDLPANREDDFGLAFEVLPGPGVLTPHSHLALPRRTAPCQTLPRLTTTGPALPQPIQAATDHTRPLQAATDHAEPCLIQARTAARGHDKQSPAQPRGSVSCEGGLEVGGDLLQPADQLLDPFVELRPVHVGAGDVVGTDTQRAG